MDESIKQFLSAAGKKGGAATTEKKRKAVRLNLAKARAARGRKKSVRKESNNAEAIS